MVTESRWIFSDYAEDKKPLLELSGSQLPNHKPVWFLSTERPSYKVFYIGFEFKEALDKLRKIYDLARNPKKRKRLERKGQKISL
jgi:hypothetical protein